MRPRSSSVVTRRLVPPEDDAPNEKVITRHSVSTERAVTKSQSNLPFFRMVITHLTGGTLIPVMVSRLVHSVSPSYRASSLQGCYKTMLQNYA